MQVSRESITTYNGEGEPPCIVMTLRADPDETTPSDLSLSVTLTGLKEPDNTIIIERLAGNVISS